MLLTDICYHRAILMNSSSHFSIAGRCVGSNEPPYFIAEVGINHNGDMTIAKQMIEAAKAAGADAVKFQTFKADEFCGDPLQQFTYQSQGITVTEPMVSMFRRCEFAPEQWHELSAYCAQHEITFMSTPQNRSDLYILLDCNVPAIKVGSDDFVNLPLLCSYAESGLPLILSCGMSDLAEVHRALDAVGWFDGYPTALLLCTSQYPTPPEDVNIAKLHTLAHAFPGLLLGFSDHTQGTLAAALAVAGGARLFEKHFTLDHNLPGSDHWFSVEPAGLADWIATIRIANSMCGTPFVRPTRSEKQMRTLARRSIVALTDVGKDELLSSANIGLRRPGGGLPPEMIDHVFGLFAARAFRRGDRLSLGDMHS